MLKALFGFFQHVQVLVQFFLAGESRAVDTLQHFVLFIAAPVRACQAHKLKGFYPSGGRAVGSGAQIGEITLGVQADDRVFRQVVDQFHFINFIFRGKTGQRVLAGYFAAHQREVLLHNFCHFLFNGGQVFRREDMLAVDVIIEPGVNGRADGKLHTREQVLDGLGHYMGRGMADGMQAFFGVGGNKFNGSIFFNGIAEVFVHAVHYG